MPGPALVQCDVPLDHTRQSKAILDPASTYHNSRFVEDDKILDDDYDEIDTIAGCDRYDPGDDVSNLSGAAVDETKAGITSTCH